MHPPAFEPRLARIAAQIAEPSRARMLAYLLGGELASAGELARAAQVSAPTASGHLARLLDEGLIACEPRGRHRYYKLADGEVAYALGALALLAERSTHQHTWASPARRRLAHARCCYGHLAGRMGVALSEQMVKDGLISAADPGYRITESGRARFTQLGLDIAAIERAPRLAYPCLDWSERRDHLAGRLPAALLAHFLAHRWLTREAGERALRLTAAGRRALSGLLPAELLQSR
jgi:DNA-binding transcriptional ArsR family regulator